MLDRDDILKNAFDKANLENEDWLEPSGSVFENAEAIIYRKKRKKRFFWIFFTLALVTASGLSMLKFNKIATSSPANEVTNKFDVLKNPSLANLNEKQISNVIPKANPAVISNNQLLRTASYEPEVASNIVTSITLNRNQTTNLRNSSSPSDNFTSSENATFSLSKILATNTEKSNDINEHVIVGNEVSGNLESIHLGTKSETIQIASTHGFQEKWSERSIVPEYVQVEINPLVNLPITRLMSIGTEPIERKRKQFKNDLTFGLGFSTMRFNLNETYITALDPADFSQNSGSGMVVSLSYGRKVANRLKIGLDFSYNNVIASSGHNSTIEYRIEDELSNQSNLIDLTMASPLGFIESSIVVGRQASVSGSSEEVVVELNNTHRITDIALIPNISFALMNYLNTSIDLELGAGVNYINQISNKLSSFKLSSANYNSISSEITADQTLIRKFTPLTSITLSAKRNFTNNYFYGMELSMRNNLLPVYVQDDFSTSITRGHFQLFVGKSF